MSINQAGFTPMIPAPRRWDFIASMMQELGYKTFVELGCKEGRTTGYVLKTIPDARVIAIDPWIPMPATDDPSAETYDKWDFEKIESDFWQNVGENKDRCEMLRTTSLTAVETMNGRAPFDMVFVDARHDYQSVKEDISAWWPLIRVGGAMVFHDYNHKWPSVERAIADSFDLMSVGLGSDSVAFVVKHQE